MPPQGAAKPLQVSFDRPNKREHTPAVLTFSYSGDLMTRLLLLILTLLFLISSPAYADWVAVGGKLEAGMGAYADSATMRREGDLVKMEVLFDFKTIQTNASVSYLSAKAQMEYDCAEQRFRGFTVMYFSGNMGSGKLLDHSSGKGKWLPVSPGSLDQTLWKVACGKK